MGASLFLLILARQSGSPTASMDCLANGLPLWTALLMGCLTNGLPLWTASLMELPLWTASLIDCLSNLTDKFFDTIYGGMVIFSFS